MIGLREGLQSGIVLSVILLCPEFRQRGKFVLLLVSIGALAGLLIGFSPLWTQGKFLEPSEWMLLRLTFDILVMYVSIALILWRSRWFLWPVLVVLLFFDMRELGFVFLDTFQMKGSAKGVLYGCLGFGFGLIPLIGLKFVPTSGAVEEVFTLPGTLVLASGLKLLFSGVGELHDTSLVIVLQKGFERFLYTFVHWVQGYFLVPEHPYIEMPLQEFGRFVSSGRMAMVLVVVLLIAPPMALLFNMYISPEPFIRVPKKAFARLKLATFRRKTFLGSVPGFLVFFFIIGLIHVANYRANPMYDPVAVPVLASSDEIVIPVQSKQFKLTDKKLHKFVFYHEKNEIIFIVILRSDGTFGVALDQCEICRPAPWNKAAQGYAQRGEHLVCKYCMSPIPTDTVNNPGGCNPIPIPFTTRDGTIVIKVSDIVRIFKAAEELPKKGTHL